MNKFILSVVSVLMAFSIFAETPEALAVTKKGLAFKTVESVPAPEIKDEPPLPLPEGMKDEVAKLVAERRAWAKPGLEAKRLEESQKALAKMKAELTDGNDGLKREIDDVTRTVKRLTHHAKGEEQANKETDEEVAMAVVVAKYGVTTIPEMMWMCSTEDGIFSYPDARALRSLYNEIIRRLAKK